MLMTSNLILSIFTKDVGVIHAVSHRRAAGFRGTNGELPLQEAHLCNIFGNLSESYFINTHLN